MSEKGGEAGAANKCGLYDVQLFLTYILNAFILRMSIVYMHIPVDNNAFSSYIEVKQYAVFLYKCNKTLFRLSTSANFSLCV